MASQLTRAFGEGGTMRRSSFFRTLLPVILSLPPAYSATLRGIVTDPSGKPIPNSRVTVFARDGQQRLTAISGEEGRYQFDFIATGAYLVQAEASGLARSAAMPLELAETD